MYSCQDTSLFFAPEIRLSTTVGLVYFIIKLSLLDNLPDKGLGIIRIIDRKIAGKPNSSASMRNIVANME